MTIWLSNELKAIRDQVMQMAMAGRSMDPHALRSMALGIDPLIDLAANDEEELRYFRLLQAGKDGRSVVEKLAGEAMGNMMLDGEAKIVRPHFGRKP